MVLWVLSIGAVRSSSKRSKLKWALHEMTIECCRRASWSISSIYSMSTLLYTYRQRMYLAPCHAADIIASAKSTAWVRCECRVGAV